MLCILDGSFVKKGCSFLGQTLGCALHLLPALLGEPAWQVSLKNAFQIFLRLSVPYYI